MVNYQIQPWMGTKVTAEWDNVPPGTHTGRDNKAAQGTPVTSPVNGTVVFVYTGTSTAGVTATFGWRVRVRDAFGRQHGFAHMHTIDVVIGQKVYPGTVLGLSGGALTDPKYKRGAATGPHIHWGVYSNDSWTLAASEGPMPYLLARIKTDTPEPPMTNRITVPAGANVRVEPTTASDIVSKLKGNRGYDALGWITGQLVSGSTVWFLTQWGWVHSSAFTDPSTNGLPDKNPVAPPVVVPPVVPTTGVTETQVKALIEASEKRVIAAITAASKAVPTAAENGKAARDAIVKP